jgi:hypothetical protein
MALEANLVGHSPMFKEEATGPQENYFYGIRVSAIAETLVFLTVLTVLNMMLGNGERFINMALHPFWIIILLITVQYGINEALAAAFLASIYLLLGNFPEQHLTETTYDYLLRLVYQPFLWFLTATIIGGLRSRQIGERNLLKESLGHAEKKAETIAAAYKRLQLVKDELEASLAQEASSSLAVYRVAKCLESLEKRNVLKAAKQMLGMTMHAGKSSLYEVGTEEKPGLEMVETQGWENGDKFQRRFEEGSVIYKKVVDRKQVLCVVQEQDEKALGEEGLLAGPIIDSQTGEVFGMIKIEAMPLASVTERNLEIFKTLCEWIGLAYANVRKYQEAKKHSFINHDQDIYSYNFLKHQANLLTFMAHRGDFTLSVITVTISNMEELSEDEQAYAAKVLGETARQMLRGTDQCFNSSQNRRFVITVPYADRGGAQIVIKKLKKALAKHKDEGLRKVQFAFMAKQVQANDNQAKEAPHAKSA